MTPENHSISSFSMMTQKSQTNICVSLAGYFSSDVPVAIPRIMFERSLISPGKVEGVRGKQVSKEHLNVGGVDSIGLVAMMSGTVIHRQVFDAGQRFDERLSFYGVDMKFLSITQNAILRYLYWIPYSLTIQR